MRWYYHVWEFFCNACGLLYSPIAELFWKMVVPMFSSTGFASTYLMVFGLAIYLIH